ncbi:MAG: Brp/Blh family beta-carotene 15,15'-dioxygenase [Balneolaceae bacterium]
MRTNLQILIQCVIGLSAIAINILFPEFTEQSRYLLLALVILLIGMPHGALDHFIDGSIEKWNPSTFNLKFYGFYILAIAIYSIFWIIFPLFSFLFFLVITWYHFGQADAKRFDLSKTNEIIIQFSRGLTVVGLITFGDIEYASQIIESVSGFSIQTYLVTFIDLEITKWVIASFYPFVYILVMFNKLSLKTFFVYLLDSFIVSLLFIYSDPVWAFSIYFGIWHSYNHVLVMLNFLSSENEKKLFGWFYKESFIFSLLSYLGLLFIYNLLDAFGNESLMVSLLFVLISVLTLPHMIIVEKMYARAIKKAINLR